MATAAVKQAFVMSTHVTGKYCIHVPHFMTMYQERLKMSGRDG